MGIKLSDQKFSIISGSIVDKILHTDYNKVVEIIEQAYIEHGAGRSINPDSYFLKFPDKPESRIIALPAHLGGTFNISGIKWISSFPANIKDGIPRASAVIILNNYENGYPIACLEGSKISAARTAASAVLAAQHLTKSKVIRRLGIVGCGLISRYVLKFLINTGWEILEVNLFDLLHDSSISMKEFCNKIGINNTHISYAKEELVSSCSFIIFTTTSGVPHVNDINLFSHNPIVLHLSLRDLAPEIILASNNVVDDIDHCLKASTSTHLAEKDVGNRNFINGEIHQLIQGNVLLDLQKPIIYSPFGMGILDLALAEYIYQEAASKNSTIDIIDFFESHREY
jgi:N-[(2S)-2-amino-2-carboxyethyl]-L-glutamate dehydrogenase